MILTADNKVHPQTGKSAKIHKYLYYNVLLSACNNADLLDVLQLISALMSL